MRPIITLAALIAALLMAGCGSSDNDGPVREDSGGTQQAAKTPAPDPDADKDGTPDAEDFDPENPQIQTRADSKNCNVLGINQQEGKEGSCTTDQGTKVKVVNRDSTLVLPQIAVKLNSIETTDIIERDFNSPLVGSFVVANITMTNRLSAPVTTNAPDQFGLALGPRQYTPDFDAMNESDEGSKFIFEELQPDESTTGDVVFRVAAKRARRLERDGNFVVLQFTDVEAVSEPEKRVGVIRTYE